MLRGEPVPQTEEDRRAPKYTGTKPPVDEKYDYEAERKDKQEAERARQKNQQITYVKRLIVHPSFINATYAQVIKYMESQDQGEAIFRPSSKGMYEGYNKVNTSIEIDIYEKYIYEYDQAVYT